MIASLLAKQPDSRLQPGINTTPNCARRLSFRVAGPCVRVVRVSAGRGVASVLSQARSSYMLSPTLPPSHVYKVGRMKMSLQAQTHS